MQQVIGKGGNGQVWRATSNEQVAAIKLQNKAGDEANVRFQDEIEIMLKNSDIRGILPVLDHHIAADRAERSWFAMPVAALAEEALRTRSWLQKAERIADVADTLAALHARDVVHRDIKPGNLLILGEDMYISDFGIARRPEKRDVTKNRKGMGPKSTIDPQVRLRGNGADLKAADVYSLAKTLWILLTGASDSFEGQYSEDPATSVALVRAPGARALHLPPLDRLLFESTHHESAPRPSMQGFGTRLREWLRINKDDRAAAPLQWHHATLETVLEVQPGRIEWYDLPAIVEVLNQLAQRGWNHVLFPSMGGLDLDGAKLSGEPGCIEIDFNGIPHVVKPRRLLLEIVPSDSTWNYFILEALPLAKLRAQEVDPDEDEPDADDIYDQSLIEVRPGMYLFPDSDAEAGTRGGRRVVRCLGGLFLLVLKTSRYNEMPDTYDARHQKMGVEVFRSYIHEIARRIAARESKR